MISYYHINLEWACNVTPVFPDIKSWRPTVVVFTDLFRDLLKLSFYLLFRE